MRLEYKMRENVHKQRIAKVIPVKQSMIYGEVEVVVDLYWIL